MENSQFIFVLDGSIYKSMYEHMLMDLTEIPNVAFVSDVQLTNMKKKLLLKSKVRQFTQGWLDFLAYEENNLYSAIEHYCKNANTTVYVIFLNASLCYNSYLPGTLRKYRNKWKNLRYILFYLDVMNVPVSRNADVLRKHKIFDLVYSIDKEDVIKSGVLPWRTFYSINEKYLKIEETTDLYFCGVSKDRASILANCAKYAECNKVKIAMDVICYDDAKDFEAGTYGVKVRTPNQYLSYTEVIRNELKAKCILEVVQKGQTALTLRPYEAIAYNKKLLTNNKSIYDFPYYDEKYMRYFENAEDIDWDWVKDETIQVNYKYGGEYSPRYLLDNIVLRLT